MFGRNVSEPILPDSFLGGTAPRLRSLTLIGVSFPALPKLLLSATHLVYLHLFYIPQSGYIPPNAMAISLSALTSLESLCLMFLCQVCTSSLPPLSTLEDLYISEDRLSPPRWEDDVENMLWLDLLRSFVAVKKLYLSEKFVPRVAPALQELVGGRTTEVLPTLENVFLEGFELSGSLHDGIEKFVAARQLTSRPIGVSRWDNESTWES